MTAAAYLYSDPLIESTADRQVWRDRIPVTIDRIYHDQGDRLELHRLLADCRAGTVQQVWVAHLADLGETMAAVGDRLHELNQLGVLVWVGEAVQPEGEADGQSVAAESFTWLRTVAETQRRRSLQRGHARNRLNALPPPGKAPYGYRRGSDRYLIDRTTAPIVKEFVEHFLLYGTLRGSVRHINQKYGKRISPSTGRRWLTSPVYRGNLEYQTGDVIPDTHAPLLSSDEAAQIDRLLRRNRRLPPKTASAPRSLAGLVTCGRCQSAMTITRVAPRGKRPEYLYIRPVHCGEVIAGTGCKAIPYHQVLDQTIAQICDRLPKAIAALQQPDLTPIQSALQQRIAHQEAVLAQLPGLVEQGILDEETANLRRYRVRATIAEVRNQLSQLPPANLGAIAQALSIPQFWQDLSETERRVYLREFIHHVTLIRSEGDRNQWSLSLQFIFEMLPTEQPR
jgi:DNA invertase Pin-like site-specific DNA recombinase